MTSEPDKNAPQVKSHWVFVVVLLAITMVCFLVVLSLHVHRLNASSWRYVCKSQLKQIDGAKATWADDRHITNENTVVPVTELYGRTNYILHEEFCPQGGTYQIGLLGQKPRCTLPGHTL
jgi:hypothetical protein